MFKNLVILVLSNVLMFGAGYTFSACPYVHNGVVNTVHKVVDKVSSYSHKKDCPCVGSGCECQNGGKCNCGLHCSCEDCPMKKKSDCPCDKCDCSDKNLCKCKLGECECKECPGGGNFFKKVIK